MLNVIMLNVIMLSDDMLSAVAPFALNCFKTLTINAKVGFRYHDRDHNIFLEFLSVKAPQ
jgi:hypothetical protein